MTAPAHPLADDIVDTLEVLAAGVFGKFRTSEDRVASVIRSAIVSGVFAPGQRLPQDTLANTLKVSRMPIRAALRQLESEGLVELIPHRGAVVRALTIAEITDLYEIRIMIETFAMRKTVTAMTPTLLSELEESADTLENAETLESRFDLRHEFYHSMYACGNTPRVVSTIMQIRGEVSRYALAVHEERSGRHRELLAQIRTGDPGLAAAWLENHLRQLLQVLRNKMRERIED